MDEPQTEELRQPRPRVSVLIPTKNEALNIGWVLRRLPESVDEVVIVDANSTDATVAAVRAHRPDAVVVVEEQPGKGRAIRAGIEAATGDRIVMLDADGSMDPRDVDRYVAALDQGYDMVKGSRFLDGGGTADMSFIRFVGHWFLLGLSNVLFRTSHTDLCYGYAAFRRDAVRGLGLTAVGFEIEAELFLRATRHGLRVGETPSFEAPRRAGKSNLNTYRDGLRVATTILRERIRPRPSTPAPVTLDEARSRHRSSARPRSARAE